MPFQKGQSGNPNGRPPREWTMAELIRDALNEEEQQSGKSFKHLVAKRLAHMAVNGDIQAIKEINDRIDGKPVQKNILANDEERPLIQNVEIYLSKTYGTQPTSSASPDPLPSDSEE